MASLGEALRPARSATAVAAHLPAVGGPVPIAADLASLIAELDARSHLVYRSLIDELAARTEAEVREAPSLWTPLGVQVGAVLDEALASFRTGVLPEERPASAASAARLAVEHPELEAPLLELPRLSHMSIWDAWFELVEARAAHPERREFLRRGSDHLFAYADFLAHHTVEAVRRERRAPDGGARRDFEAVKGVLDGDPGAAAALAYDLERHHLGLLAWGGDDPAALAREVAHALERPFLCVAAPERPPICWAWVSGTRPLSAAEEQYLRDFQLQGAGRIALGLEGPGVPGFCAGHRQACRARRFAAAGGPPLLHYEDVVVESLAAENEEDARAFVAHELRGIDDETVAARRIRETLVAYFAAECNAASAGAALGVHQQTVANRLRAAEHRLGRDSIGVRRVELELALRLRARIAFS
jgi:hypothetical protein